MESCQNPKKPLSLPNVEGTDDQLAAAVRAYQQGFNDRQMGREKRLPTGKVGDYSYNLGYHDGKAIVATNPQTD
jgi:hypothetical protein